MQPVVILGAGINGAAVARDLAINGVPVVIVDTGDIAQGATSRSSRLIHGGLRYLEYRDLALVRESLAEREHLLRTAPQFVRPLQLQIPVRRLTGGLLAAAIRFCGLSKTRIGTALLSRCHSPRGLIAVRFGLWLYDRLARGSSLPRHSVTRNPETRIRHAVTGHAGIKRPGTGHLEAGHPAEEEPVADQQSPQQQFSPQQSADQQSAGPRPASELWWCSYWDAQLEFPERFVLSMLHDAQAAAREAGVEFRVLPRHRVHWVKGQAAIEPVREPGANDAPDTSANGDRTELRPVIMINATGAWGDRTLQTLGVREQQLFSGTRGSHLFTPHEGLRRAVGESGIYAEADDGRLVFILPLCRGVLIGTTDLPHQGSPGDAVATEDEVAYLLHMVNSVLPGTDLRREHVEVRHAGVRPLPRTSSRTAAAIPRGHSVRWSETDGLAIATLIGGKLTTCRQLGEEVTDAVLDRLARTRVRSTVNRPLPGSDVARPGGAVRNNTVETAPETCSGFRADQRMTIRRLAGERLEEIQAAPEFHTGGDGFRNVAGTTVPRGFVRWSIAREWVTNLNDLVERRLMLIFEPDLRRETLEELAELLIAAGQLDSTRRDTEVDRCAAALLKFQGKRVLPEADGFATVADV